MTNQIPSQSLALQIQEDRELFKLAMRKIQGQRQSPKAPDGEEVGGRNPDFLNLLKVRIFEPPPALAPENKQTKTSKAADANVALSPVSSFDNSLKPDTPHTGITRQTGTDVAPRNRVKTKSGKPPSPVDFNVPATRGVRPATDDGRTSFHLSHESITKTHKATEAENGLKNRPGAAQAHMKYLERPGAVAEIDAILKTPEQLEAERLAVAQEQDVNVNKNGGDVAVEQKELVNVEFTGIPFTATISRHAFAIRESIAAKFAARKSTGTLASMPVLSSLNVVSHNTKADVPLWGNGSDRLERSGVAGNGLRWARGSSGEIVVSRGGIDDFDEPKAAAPVAGFASQHGVYLERQEAIARMGDGSLVLFTNIPGTAQDRAQVWDVIEEFEDKPGKDSVTIDTGRTPEFWKRVSNNDACPDELRNAIRCSVETRVSTFKVKDGKFIRRWLAKQKGWDAEAPQASFSDARGGRVQYRIIGELPHELSTQERASILKEYAQIFEEKKLPYVAVMHAPDHTNDSRNWHFHLVYYDRPINKMPDGQWDFAIQKQATNKWGNKWTTWPHRQNKVREVTEKPWVPMLRKRLADITNDHLKRAKLVRRLDPRKYSEMGIDRQPQEHLGTNRSALEAMGVATPAGASNAQKEWDALERSIFRRHENADLKTTATGREWTDALASTVQSATLADAVHREIVEWTKTQKAADEYKFMADLVLKANDQSLSRAKKTAVKCRKEINAINDGKGSNSRKNRLPAITETEAKALDHIRLCTAAAEEHVTSAHQWNARSVALQAEADAMAIVIAKSVAANIALQPSPDIVSPTKDDTATTASRSRLIAEIARNPGMVARQTDGPARGAAILKTPHKSLLEAFRNYGAEHEIQIAVRKALYENDVAIVLANLARVDTTPIGKSAAKTTPSAPTLEAVSPDSLPTLEAVASVAVAAPRPHRDLTPAFDEIARAPLRIRIVGGYFKVHESLISALKLRNVDMESSKVQRRLKGIQEAQDRDIRRLEAYVRSRPYVLDEVDGHLTVWHRAPIELQDIASKWADDIALQNTFKLIADAAKSKSASGSNVGASTAAGNLGGRPSERIAPKPDLLRQTGAPSAGPVETNADQITVPDRERLSRDVHIVFDVRPAKAATPIRDVEGQGPSPRGIDPKIDAWLDAESDKLPESARIKLAAGAISDQAALKSLEAINPDVSDRLKRDSASYRRLEAAARQLQLDQTRDR